MRFVSAWSNLPPDQFNTSASPAIGVKWSPVASRVLSLVDCVEVPGWDPGGVPTGIPTLLHNIDLDFSLAKPDVIDDAWLERANTLISRTGTPWLSLHLGLSAERVRFAGHMLPESETLPRELVQERILDALMRAKSGIDVPLIIENLDYCPEGAYEHVCEPAFIRDVLESLDCGLLLDLAHARVSADWLGYDIQTYLSALPLDRVVELHLSSPRHLGGRLDDSHCELTEHDYELLSRLLTRTSPRAIVLEYTHRGDLLESQLRGIRENADASSRG